MAAHAAACFEPRPGAHVATPRRGYVHHGIYVGQGRVVHYAGFSRLLLTGPVCESAVPEFTRGRDLWVLERHAPCFAPDEVIRRARSRLGEDAYRLLSNNCEHFCLWCLTGEARSEQVERLLQKAGGLLRRRRHCDIRATSALPANGLEVPVFI